VYSLDLFVALGSRRAFRRMGEYSPRQEIAPGTGHFPTDGVNNDVEHLRSGAARCGIVLSNGSTPTIIAQEHFL
jgi:hypothetical protein